jgi:hypothetical protein
MFNREKLSITHQELADDLAHFGMLLPESVNNQRLGDVDSVFGSFFFIHRSQAREVEGPASTRRLAYEFLHNTFGEYLCAEFLLRRIFELVADLATMKMNPRLAAYRERLLDDPNQLGHDWYGCWISTPLSTRPVLVEMIQEIVETNSHDGDGSRFGSPELPEFDRLIHNHLGCVLSGRTIPSAMLTFQGSANATSLLSRIAVYSMNLIVVRCALCPKGYNIGQGELSRYFGNQDPWDRIVHLWLAATPGGGRWSIGGLLRVEHTDQGVHLALRKPFETSIAGSSTRAFGALNLSIARELQDQADRSFEIFFCTVFD